MRNNLLDPQFKKFIFFIECNNVTIDTIEKKALAQQALERNDGHFDDALADYEYTIAYIGEDLNRNIFTPN